MPVSADTFRPGSVPQCNLFQHWWAAWPKTRVATRTQPWRPEDCTGAGCQHIQVNFLLRWCWTFVFVSSFCTLELSLSVCFHRDVSNHLNYDHRVFHSEEFLKSRLPNEQLFYKKVFTNVKIELWFDQINKNVRWLVNNQSEMLFRLFCRCWTLTFSTPSSENVSTKKQTTLLEWSLALVLTCKSKNWISYAVKYVFSCRKGSVKDSLCKNMQS